MVCNALVAVGRLLGTEQASGMSPSHNFPHPGPIAYCSAPNSLPPANKALHTICGNNTSIVSSSWWWAYKCPKHVEQIVSAIKHSAASSWFSSLRLYYNARTNIVKLTEYLCAKWINFRLQSVRVKPTVMCLSHWTHYVTLVHVSCTTRGFWTNSTPHRHPTETKCKKLCREVRKSYWRNFQSRTNNASVQLRYCIASQ